MLHFRLSTLIVVSLCSLTFAQTRGGGERGPNVPDFWIRPGYRVTLAADKLPEARFMEFDDKGTLYLSQPGAGSITTLIDKDKDGTYEILGKFITNKKTAHGMCWHDGWLYFTQSGAIHKARDTNGDGVADEVQTIIPEDSLPRGGGHWWRSILVTDDAMYTSIGDSTNLTDESASAPERQKIWKFDLKGENKKLFATGVRNTEKLRIRPGTKEIYGCDHGSDNFGLALGEKKGYQPLTDSMPPCEFNHYVEGGFYGHPFVVGNKVPRPEFEKKEDILELVAKTISPEWCFGAHWAPNGWTFISRDYFPGHKGDTFCALHGSWNSTVKVGYRVERIIFDNVTNKPCGSQMIVGALSDDSKTVLARPCDCVEAPDGTILFTCDQTRKIFRISRTAASASAN
jgi:glucose/arabinose dehydrogenase